MAGRRMYLRHAKKSPCRSLNFVNRWQKTPRNVPHTNIYWNTIICKELVPRQQFVRLIGDFDLEILIFLMLHLLNVHVLQTHWRNIITKHTDTEKLNRFWKKTKAKLASPYLMFGEHVDRELYFEAVWGKSWATKKREAIACDIIIYSRMTYIDELIPFQKFALQNNFLILRSQCLCSYTSLSFCVTDTLIEHYHGLL